MGNMLRYTTPRSQVLEKNLRRYPFTGAAAVILTLVCLCASIFHFGTSDVSVHHRALAAGQTFEVGNKVKCCNANSSYHNKEGRIIEKKTYAADEWKLLSFFTNENNREYIVRFRQGRFQDIPMTGKDLKPVKVDSTVPTKLPCASVVSKHQS